MNTQKLYAVVDMEKNKILNGTVSDLIRDCEKLIKNIDEMRAISGHPPSGYQVKQVELNIIEN